MTDQTGCWLWQRSKRTMTWWIIQMQSMPKTKLICHYRSNRVHSMMKTRYDNDITNCTNVIYNQNEIELSCLMGLGAICDKKETGKWCNRLYRYGPRRKWNRVLVIDWIEWVYDKNQIGTTTWLIVQVRSTLKMKPSYSDRSDWVRSLMKTKQDNNMRDHIDVIYYKKETELLWPIGSSTICDKNRTAQRCDRSYKSGLHWKWY